MRLRKASISRSKSASFSISQVCGLGFYRGRLSERQCKSPDKGENRIMAAAEEIIALTRGLREVSAESPETLARRASELAERSRFELVNIGSSSAGTEIQALHWPGQGRRIVSWGYPHPDEPIGAMALVMLSEMLAAGQAPAWVESLDWWIVLCADPDQATLNRWTRNPSLSSYLESNWRPLYSGLEVDYHFPISSPPFLQRRGQSAEGLSPPLPESCALADLLDMARPDLLCLMHSNHVAGAYDYFAKRPSPELVAAFDQVAKELNVARHLAERPDPGRRWKTSRPDLLKEPALKDRLKRAEGRFGDLTGLTLAGCVSAAQYLESLSPDSQVLTPEAGIWTPTGIDDTSPSGEVRKVTVRRFQKNGSWREGIYGHLLGREICYQTAPASGGAPQRSETIPLTRGMAGVEAVEARRHFLDRADRIFEQAKPLLEGQDSRWLRERRAITIPGSRVNDRSMLIFRSDAAYRRQATVAQETDLRLRWGMQSCLWLSHSLQMYRHHSLDRQADAQEELLSEARGSLLQGLEETPSLDAAARSQLARLLLCASA